MKKMKFITMLIIAMICVSCSGSSSVNKAITQVEKALEKVEKNKGNMSESDWKNIEKEMEGPLQVIAHALESNEVGMMERIKLMAVAAKWATVAMEAGFAEIEKQTGVHREELGNELEKAVREIEKAAQELERTLNR
ncbi:MAG: hypothetical protein FWE99_06695 [Bacteroidales bacterium]|nr:hypothetical protein [Bacteroidales bacterium]